MQHEVKRAFFQLTEFDEAVSGGQTREPSPHHRHPPGCDAHQLFLINAKFDCWCVEQLKQKNQGQKYEKDLTTKNTKHTKTHARKNRERTKGPQNGSQLRSGPFGPSRRFKRESQ